MSAIGHRFQRLQISWKRSVLIVKYGPDLEKKKHLLVPVDSPIGTQATPKRLAFKIFFLTF